MMKTPATNFQKETSSAERFSYTLYFLGQNTVYMVIQSYLLMYYVSHLKINPVLVAIIFLVVRIWDAINDPMIGVFLDRFRLINSRHKNWLTLTSVLMPLSTFLLFTAPAAASSVVKIAYIIVSYLAWDVLYTMSEVPSFAISTSMTRNEQERTLLLTLTQIGSVLGAAIGVGLSTIFLGNGVDNINWLLMAGTPSLLAFVAMLPQLFWVKERHNTEIIKEVTLREMLRDLFRNDQHFIIMSLYLSQAFLNAVSVFMVYVAEGYYGNAQLASLTSVFSLLGVVALGIFTPAIVRRWGKKRFLETSMLATILLSVPIFFIPASMPVIALIFMGTRIMTLVVTSLLRPMFTADCIEYGEYKTGTRSDSSAFAVQTFFNKTGDALGTALGGFVLALVRFDENLPLNAQSFSTISSLQIWNIILPMLMAAVIFLGVRYFYKIDEEKVAKFIIENEKNVE